jgi:hypothetical protein
MQTLFPSWLPLSLHFSLLHTPIMMFYLTTGSNKTGSTNHGLKSVKW